ncbi:FAD/NAD(P)-binding protein [Paracoccus spongiarum]|uniref:FAD/NAD(P)-binding protein n=1 Tax=Paracoccus spongiarum TaxID=3064387 RepID=UPI003531892D
MKIDILAGVPAPHAALRVSVPEGRHMAGCGVACSTRGFGHLPNRRLADMRALPGDPDHLRRWLEARGDHATGDCFVGRMTCAACMTDRLTPLSADGRLRCLCATGTRLATTRGEVAEHLGDATSSPRPSRFWPMAPLCPKPTRKVWSMEPGTICLRPRRPDAWSSSAQARRFSINASASCRRVIGARSWPSRAAPSFRASTRLQHRCRSVAPRSLRAHRSAPSGSGCAGCLRRGGGGHLARRPGRHPGASFRPLQRHAPSRSRPLSAPRSPRGGGASSPPAPPKKAQPGSTWPRRQAECASRPAAVPASPATAQSSVPVCACAAPTGSCL